MSAGCRTARWSGRASTPTHRVAALRTFAFPGPSIKMPPVEALPLGAAIEVVRDDGTFAITPQQHFLPLQHLSALERVRERFRQHRRALRRRAVSLGRQDGARHRLLGPRADRARRLRHGRAARQRPAAAGAGRGAGGRRDRRSAPWRPDLLEGTRGDRARPRRRSCTPTPFTWRSRSSRSPRRTNAFSPRAPTSSACAACSSRRSIRRLLCRSRTGALASSSNDVNRRHAPSEHAELQRFAAAA